MFEIVWMNWKISAQRWKLLVVFPYFAFTTLQFSAPISRICYLINPEPPPHAVCLECAPSFLLRIITDLLFSFTMCVCHIKLKLYSVTYAALSTSVALTCSLVLDWFSIFYNPDYQDFKTEYSCSLKKNHVLNSVKPAIDNQS